MIPIFQTVPSRESEAIRLFCIPHAGGGASAFRGWRESLLPEVEATVIQLPGREARFRERPYREMHHLVEDLAASVLPWLNPGQPFAFFGNSLGGLIANRP
jgi:medium-chain acyl-[acyl-carrier-protein] hydrolase